MEIGAIKRYLIISKFSKSFTDMIYEEILIFHFDQFKKTYEENKKKGKSIIKHIMEGETSKMVPKTTYLKLILIYLLDY